MVVLPVVFLVEFDDASTFDVLLAVAASTNLTFLESVGIKFGVTFLGSTSWGLELSGTKFEGVESLELVSDLGVLSLSLDFSDLGDSGVLEKFKVKELSDLICFKKNSGRAKIENKKKKVEGTMNWGPF